MRGTPHIVLLFAALSCAGPAGEGDDVGRAEPPELPTIDDQEPGAAGVVRDCDATITWMQPGQAAAYVSTDADLLLAFSTPLPEHAGWSLALDGVPGRAHLSADRTGARFVPDEPLAYRHAYTLTASACGQERSHSFTTAPPPVPPEQLAGRTWAARFDDVSWLSPAAASVFVPLIDLDAILIRASSEWGPTGAQALRLEVVLAQGEGDHLEPLPCLDPVDLGRIDLSHNPVFVTSPVDLFFPFGDATLVSPATQLFGVFDDEGSRLVDLDLVGMIDVRALGEVLPGVNVCTLSAGLGEPCAACPDGVVACLEGLARIGTLEELPEYDLDDAVEEVARTTYCP